MSSSNDSTTPNPTNITTKPEVEVVEINLADLTDTQKLTIYSVIGTIILQIIFLFNVGLFTDLFKGLIAQSYKDIPDYVRNFVSTLVPYLLVICITIALYIIYLVLIEDPDYLKAGSQTFDLLGIGLIASFFLYFIAVVSIPPLPINSAFPNTVEFFIFLTTMLVIIIIALLPFEVYHWLTGRQKKPVLDDMAQNT